MADVVSAAVRSRMMAGIKGKNTNPELLLRKGLHARGFRFRLHDSALPGKPDIVLPRYRAVIFAHGCFWHQHPDCKLASKPKSAMDYWGPKLARNVMRDGEAAAALQSAGWRVETIWEGDTRVPARLQARLEEIFALPISLETGPQRRD